jgi:hypothetical protein
LDDKIFYGPRNNKSEGNEQRDDYSRSGTIDKPDNVIIINTPEQVVRNVGARHKTKADHKCGNSEADCSF